VGGSLLVQLDLAMDKGIAFKGKDNTSKYYVQNLRDVS